MSGLTLFRKEILAKLNANFVYNTDRRTPYHSVSDPRAQLFVQGSRHEAKHVTIPGSVHDQLHVVERSTLMARDSWFLVSNEP